MKKKALFLPLFFALLACGCNDGKVGLGGKVTYTDGAPVTMGAVVFIQGKTFQANGAIGADGMYQMESGGKPGLPPGKYKVYISGVEKRDPNDPNAMPIPLVAQKWTTPNTSGLEFTVAEKNEPYNIVVERNPDPRAK